MNRKIQKATLNYDLAEQYAPITQLQEKQIKHQDENTRAIEDQTKMIEEATTPSLKSPTQEAIEADEDENEDNVPIRAINSDISDDISSLLNQVNAHPQMKFSRQNFNNYSINDKPFELHDDIIEFDGKINRISSRFFKIFIKGTTLSTSDFTQKQMNLFNDFVDYAGGLRGDKRSNLHKVLKSYKDSLIQEIDGKGTSFIFLSSEPNILVERLEVLVGESLAGNTNAFREASAILYDLLRMKEITETEYEKAMKIFID